MALYKFFKYCIVLYCDAEGKSIAVRQGVTSRSCASEKGAVTVPRGLKGAFEK